MGRDLQTQSRVAPNQTLLVEPETHVFSAGQDENAAQALEDVLLKHQSGTKLLTVRSAADLQVDAKGRLQTTYQLSTLAFGQLCGQLAKGLSFTLYSLAGIQPSALDLKHEDYDEGLALGIYNGIVNRRWKRLAGCKLVIDPTRNRVEGIVGRRYHLQPNYDLYKQVSSYVAENRDHPAEFWEALLCGRRLVVRFKSLAPLFSIEHETGKEESFYGGYQFENTEVGKVALRGGAVIIRDWCDGKASTPLEDALRVRHVKGGMFQRKFLEMLRLLDTRVDVFRVIEARVKEMRGYKLGLGGNPKQHQERLKSLTAFLLRRGIGKPTAEKVLNRMLVFGSYRSEKLTAGVNPLAIYARRTLYDLYNALTSSAKRLPLESRLAAESLAFVLITSKCNP